MVFLVSFNVSLYNKPAIRAGRNNETKQATTAGEPIPLSNYFKYGNQLTQSSDGKYIVIGEGVKIVRITGQLHFAVNDTKCGLAIRVLKANGVNQMIGCAYGSDTYTSNATVLLEVEEGDKLYIATTSDSVINPSNGGGFRSYLMVEKIA